MNPGPIVRLSCITLCAALTTFYAAWAGDALVREHGWDVIFYGYFTALCSWSAVSGWREYLRERTRARLRAALRERGR